MNLHEEILKTLAKPIINGSIETVSEEEIKRLSLPEVQLNELEQEFLKGLATGRTDDEMAQAVKLYTNDRLTYNAVKNLLLNKFEANSMPHLIFKACKMGYLKELLTERI